MRGHCFPERERGSFLLQFVTIYLLYLLRGDGMMILSEIIQTLLLEVVMAEAAKEVVVKDAMDRGWIKKALESQRAMLIRSRTKEMTGSEVWHLRGREIEQLNLLIGKFS